MKMVYIALLSMSLFLSACAKDGEVGPQGPPGPVATPTPATPQEQAIADVVDAENEYRLGLGQTMLTTGLSCTLYTVTGGSTILSGANQLTGVSQVATFLLTKPFNQDNTSVSEGLNVLPESLMSNPRHKNLIKLTCTGQLVVTETAYYKFDLTSDDGSLLYIGGALLVNNDGNHGANTVSGTKYLRKGVHAFRLDFAQTGGGSQALVLKANGELVDPMHFVH